MQSEKNKLKKDLKHKLSVIIDSFVRANTKSETKKMRKAVKEASNNLRPKKN